MCGWWLVVIPVAATIVFSYGYRVLWRSDPRSEGALLSILIFAAMLIGLFFYEHSFCSGSRL
jgi:hypothetical protein